MSNFILRGVLTRSMLKVSRGICWRPARLSANFIVCLALTSLLLVRRWVAHNESKDARPQIKLRGISWQRERMDDRGRCIYAAGAFFQGTRRTNWQTRSKCNSPWHIEVHTVAQAHARTHIHNTIITQQYCVVWNYEPKALSLREELQNKFRQ